MLTESFIVSTLNPEKLSNTVNPGIHLYNLQPLPALKSTFKKSSTKTNCLAVSASHVFAAQADKAVVHVYSRDRNNQEAIVPFPEKIHSIVLAGESDGAGTLILGTEGGRLILWELGTGRQVSTPQHHLQSTICLAVDPTSNFVLSGSPDSMIHLWSIPSLLSFSASSTNGDGHDLPFSPLRTLSHHRAGITAIAFGHSFGNQNIAVSASKDNTCIVWDYMSGESLHTFLLPSSAFCLALDPADRAVYAGYEDSSVQLIDFYSQGGLTHPLYNPTLQATPTQPPTSDRWSFTHHSTFPILCLQVSYDGTSLLSGHQDGKIHFWDIAAGKYDKILADFAAPITNMVMLKPTGFPEKTRSAVKLHNIIKPRYESFVNGTQGAPGASIPTNYAFVAQFTSNLPLPLSTNNATSFHEALHHSSFPAALLEECLAEFSAPQQVSNSATESSELALLRAQNSALSSRLEIAEERHRSAAAIVQEQKNEEWRRQKDEDIKAERKKRRRLRRMRIAEVAREKQMGEVVDDEDEDMNESGKDDEEDLSSSTDEMTESD